MSLTAVARIREAALNNNLSKVRESAPGCRIIAVVKADAYGHGLEQVARVLESVDAFAVARIDEAERLRRSLPDKRIVVLSGWLDGGDLESARANRFDLVVHERGQIDALASGPGEPIDVWLKIDTGMGRLGVAPADSPAAIDRLRGAASVGEVRLMTHLASADETGRPDTDRALDQFASVAGEWDGDVSIANSAAILAWPEAVGGPGRLRYGGENWVRPGLMLYGITPFADRSASDLGLVPVMSMETRLVAVRDLPAGSRVGYGGAWSAERDSRVGVAAVGYGDGYPWHVPNGVDVVVNGTRAPVVGRVSMDLISIDLTDAPGASVGDTVVLWGNEPDVSEISKRAETIPYELVTGVASRVTRVYEP